MSFPVINLVTTGQNINMFRKQKGISTAELSEELGLSGPTTVYKWMRGDALPSLDNLVVLAKVLDVTIDDILAVDDIRM